MFVICAQESKTNEVQPLHRSYRVFVSRYCPFVMRNENRKEMVKCLNGNEGKLLRSFWFNGSLIKYML